MHETSTNHTAPTLLLRSLLAAVFIFLSAAADKSHAVSPDGWQEVGGFKETAPEPSPTRMDELSGFIPYSRNYMEPIYEITRPRSDEITNHFSVSLAREEYEPLVVALYGLDDISAIRLEISGVRSKTMQIARNQFEIRKIESRAVWAEGSKKKAKKYRLIPSLLRLTNTADLQKGRTTAFWITVHATKEDLPGEYHGQIVISQNGDALRSLHFEVRILPFTLEEIPDRIFSVLYTPTNLPPEMELNARRLLRDMRIHGMTGYSPIVSAWGEPLEFDDAKKPKVEDLVHHLQWAKEEGFQQPTLLNINKLLRTGRPRNDANYKKFNPLVDVPNMKKLVRYLEGERESHQWPEIIYLPIDEPGCFTDKAGTKREEIAVLLLKTLSDLHVRGATTVADLVDNKHRKRPRWKNVAGWWDKMRPYCAVRIYANGYPEGPTRLANERKDAAARGHAVMLYENKATMGIDPALSRMYFGYYGWRTGAKGITAWTHPLLGNATGFHVWANLEERRQERESYFKDKHWEPPPSTVCWEMVREGIDDAKYLYAFQKALHERKESGTKFMNMIKELESAVDSTKMAEKNPQCGWQGTKFSVFRERLARAIIELSRAESGLGETVEETANQ